MEESRMNETVLSVRILQPVLQLRPWKADQTIGSNPDTELVRAAQRDPAQFLALYDRYFPRIHGYVRLHIDGAVMCEDITSHVFMTALANIATFRGGSFGAWLFSIAHHAIHDVYRTQREVHIAEEIWQVLPANEPGPEEQATAGERGARLQALVRTLPQEQQHLLFLRYGAELSFREIEQVLGKNAATLRVSIHRILNNLRRRYSNDE